MATFNQATCVVTIWPSAFVMAPSSESIFSGRLRQTISRMFTMSSLLPRAYLLMTVSILLQYRCWIIRCLVAWQYTVMGFSIQWGTVLYRSVSISQWKLSVSSVPKKSRSKNLRVFGNGNLLSGVWCSTHADVHVLRAYVGTYNVIIYTE